MSAPGRLAAMTTADLESARDEYHTRCSLHGETLTDREYATYCRINTILGRREGEIDGRDDDEHDLLTRDLNSDGDEDGGLSI